MKRVLVAEDEAAIREFVVINLRHSGYDVVQASDGAQALAEYEAAEGRFDLALLDVMMPEVDGLEVCRRLREQNSRIGIIILTARTQEMDKVTGLLTGADDYITKPFSPSELMARVDAVYRRVTVNAPKPVQNTAQDVLISGEFRLDLRNRSLVKNGQRTELTQTEFQIMEFFFSNSSQALSRAQILRHVWNHESMADEKIIDVNVRRLRMKIEPNPSVPKHIATVWGVGYQWNP
ncbi:MAG: response regulator transcription factor [Oscillospiraceae bacterium]|jgi:DNA-binding response OmpR family regulator|nr:response regulator transcription factor [Oscillospiraceae bacterium]